MNKVPHILYQKQYIWQYYLNLIKQTASAKLNDIQTHKIEREKVKYVFNRITNAYVSCLNRAIKL